MKKFLFIQEQAPHKSLTPREGLDAVLMGSAFVECSLLFLGDGIFQILKGQDTAPLSRKNFTLGYAALKDYGVENIYCYQNDLDERMLKSDDLTIDIQVLTQDEIPVLFNNHDVILTF